MTRNEIIAQILGFIVVIICAIMPQMKKKSSLIFCNLIANVLIAIEFALVSAFTGMGTAIVTIVRSLVLYLYSCQNKRAPVWVPCLLILTHVAVVFTVWQSWVSALVLIGALNTYGQWQEDINVTRKCIVVVTIGFGIYNLLVGTYTGAFNEFLQCGSAIVALYRFRKKDLIAIC